MLVSSSSALLAAKIQELTRIRASLLAQMVKNPPGDPGLILGSGRSPGEGTGNPFQFSCLENSWTEEPGGLQSMAVTLIH